MKEELTKSAIWKKVGLKNNRKTIKYISLFFAFIQIFITQNIFSEVYEWGGNKRFDYYFIDNIKIHESERINAIRLKRFSPELSDDLKQESVYLSFNESFLDLSHGSHQQNSETYMALWGEKIIKADYRIIHSEDSIGNAASFELQNHTLWMNMPNYIFFNRNKGINDFSVYFRIKFYKLRQNAEFFSRYGFYNGRKTGMAGTWNKEKIKFEFYHFFSNKKQSLSYLEIATKDTIEKNKYYSVLLRYHAGEGSLALYLNGVEQNKIFITENGNKYGTIIKPSFHPWDRSPVVLARNFLGSIDEIIFSNKILPSDPSVGTYGKVFSKDNFYTQKKGIIIGKVHRLKYSQSKIYKIEYTSEETSSTDLDLYFRFSNKPFKENESEEILPFQKISTKKRIPFFGKYYQFKAILYSDSNGEKTPSLFSVKMHYLDNPPPAPPKFLSVYNVNSKEVQLTFMRNNEMDVLNGGKYMIYYGIRPYEPIGKIYYKDIVYQSGVIKKVSYNDRTDRLETKDFRMQNRILVKINNDIINKNFIYIKDKPHLYFKNPPLQEGIPYYFWVTSSDSFWEEDSAFFDHESSSSNTVIVRVKDGE